MVFFSDVSSTGTVRAAVSTGPAVAMEMTQTSPAANDRRGLRWPWLLLVWLVAALVMGTHRPASVLHPAFWAEDGHVWFFQAYRDGPVRQLANTEGGYLQLSSRLIADVALLVPLHLAPLVMNGLAILVDALPVVFLLSRRGENWGALRYRALIAVLYLCIPNAAEWHANATGTQWPVALLALMVILASLPEGWPGRVLDLSLLTLGALTGPFCIFLLPVAAIMAWARREKWRIVYAAWIVPFVLLQAAEILLRSKGERFHTELGASFPLLVKILAVRIFAASVLRSTASLYGPHVPLAVTLLIVAGCVALMAVALWQGPLELRMFVLFTGEFFLVAMARPMVTDSALQWPTLLLITDCRYYLYPMLSFLLCIGFLAVRSRVRVFRWCAAALLCLSPIGVARGWTDYGNIPGIFTSVEPQFKQTARIFELAPAGTRVDVPAEPFPKWGFVLVKH